jgi:hypothetical protein
MAGNGKLAPTPLLRKCVILWVLHRYIVEVCESKGVGDGESRQWVQEGFGNPFDLAHQPFAQNPKGKGCRLHFLRQTSSRAAHPRGDDGWSEIFGD